MPVTVPRWNPVGDWVSGAIGGAIEDLATAIVEALGQVVSTLATFWVNTPTVSVTGADGMSASSPVAFLQGGLWYWTVSLAVLAVIIGGIRMVWERRGQPLRDVLRALITLVVVSGAGLGAISLLIIAADEFSTWIIDEATAGNGFADAMKTLMIMPSGGGIAVFMIIIMGLIGICTSVIQIVLMIVRSGMLVILAGILPTTAAFSNTEMGNQWLQKTIGWTLAFILYKPAAAIVYATAFSLMDGGGQSSLLSTISGTALMVVALVALPALMRFTAPMVGAVAGGAGGGMAGAGVAAAALGSLPSGASGSGSAGRGGGNAAPAPSSTGSNGRDGGQGTSGTNAASSPSGSPTAGGGGGNGAKPTPGSVPSQPGAAAGAATGAKAGSAAGPAGAGAGAAAGAVAKAAKKGGEGVKEISDEAAGEGPSGSAQQ